jgi:hypothetical protein
MQNTTRDLNKDAGKAHGPPEGGAMDFHALNTAEMDDTGGGQSRRPPALSLEARPGLSPVESPAPPNAWNMTSDRNREGATPQPEPEIAAYRARMLAKVGGDQSRAIAFTDEELAGFIDHAKGLGFSQEDIEAILAVKMRKHWVKCATLKEVTYCLAQKRTEKRILFKEGWDFMRAYRVAQEMMLGGNALAPEVYLASDYMDEHTKTFTGKASYLMPGESFDKFVNPEKTKTSNLGYNGALYVSSDSEIDRVLASANGEITLVESMLGIRAGAWKGKGGLWRVDIHAPETKGLRIPDGFEASANEFWTPGAITSGGSMEAVLDEVIRTEANHTYHKGYL